MGDLHSHHTQKCEAMEVLINLIVAITSQCVHKHAIMLDTHNIQIYFLIASQDS